MGGLRGKHSSVKFNYFPQQPSPLQVWKEDHQPRFLALILDGHMYLKISGKRLSWKLEDSVPPSIAFLAGLLRRSEDLGRGGA